MSEPVFKDHFSGHAASYAAFRPAYPAALFDWLAELSPGHDLAWDCATGSGQAARGLAPHFRKVIATDASAEQIRQAEGQAGNPANITFRTEPAERASMESRSVDLVTVAQAYHWLDHSAFLREIERVLRPEGVLALWSYQLASVSREVDAVVLALYAGPLDAWWPPERRWVESGYRDLAFSWPDLPVPAFHMQLEWSLEAFIGYLRTWSATRRHLAATGTDAVAAAEPELRSAWGNVAERTVRWPINLRAFRAGKS